MPPKWTDEETERWEKQYQRDSNVVAVALFVFAAVIILALLWLFRA